jgi:glycosyltransferase involved in cell wall biosynthesis
MRIAVINYTSRRIGGVETYLEALFPLLEQRGHDLIFWAETDVPSNRPPIRLPSGTKLYSAKDGKETSAALSQVKAWSPDVIYVQKLEDPELEMQMLEIRPAIYFAHDYHGTCISGKKSHAFPTLRPCSRVFGLPCLAYYFPRRCGGLSPITMFQLYARQSQRLKTLKRYGAVLVASEHMALEYKRHGITAHVNPYTHVSQRPRDAPTDEVSKEAPSTVLKVAFLGRMEDLKGGELLIKALPEVASRLKLTVECHFAGQGSAETKWKNLAANLMKRSQSVNVHFHGWLGATDCRQLLMEMHLMIMPSVWPEPFGGVGSIAGEVYVPAVAFAVGGIPQWLHNGINGILAPGDPPTARGLASAMVQAVQDPDLYRSLCRGAFQHARNSSIEAHVADLEMWLARVAGRKTLLAVER